MSGGKEKSTIGRTISIVMPIVSSMGALCMAALPKTWVKAL